MKIIAGLGNPTKEYEGTRHNIGFSVIDRIADQYNISMQERKHKAVCGKGRMEGEKVILLKPQTYMNLSGESIAEAAAYYKIDLEEDLIVIYDDIDLDVGRIRVRSKGSAGGHNGMKSIIKCLGTQVFSRVRVGVGAKPKGWDLADHVLGRFSKDELPMVEEGREAACRAVELLVTQGAEAAMNQMNVRKS